MSWNIFNQPDGMPVFSSLWSKINSANARQIERSITDFQVIKSMNFSQVPAFRRAIQVNKSIVHPAS